MPNSCDDNHAVWHFLWTFNNRNEAICMESSLLVCFSTANLVKVPKKSKKNELFLEQPFIIWRKVRLSRICFRIGAC